MTIRAIKPFIPSGNDFRLALAFFRDLGFVVGWESDALAELSMNGVAFLLQNHQNAELQRNLMMMVSVEDLDAWWIRIVDSGVLDRYAGAKAKPPTDYPWGQREIHLIDPAGVCWHFVEARTEG
jgi:uncharacterized glyoxalase superfamily protein PhnB